MAPAAAPVTEGRVTRLMRADVVVIGGGPAAAGAASSLAASGLTVALVHKFESSPTRLGESLPPGVASHLTAMGVWRAAPHERCGAVRVSWGRDGDLREADLNLHHHGSGLRLDRYAFDADGLNACAAHGVDLIEAIGTVHVDCRGSGAAMQCRTARGSVDVHTSFAIDCTGRVSAVARRHGVRRMHADRLVAVVTTLRHIGLSQAYEDDSSLTVEADRDGWWYSCRIPRGQRVLAYFTDRDLMADELRQSSALMQAMKGTTLVTRECDAQHWEPLGAATSIHAANSSRLSAATGLRWLAAGDAAMAFDPLSSIGILAAVSGGQRAADAVVRAFDGDDSAFEEYQHFNDEVWQHYTRELRGQYGYETRWAQQPFWHRRQRPAVGTSAGRGMALGIEADPIAKPTNDRS